MFLPSAMYFIFNLFIYKFNLIEKNVFIGYLIFKRNFKIKFSIFKYNNSFIQILFYIEEIIIIYGSII